MKLWQSVLGEGRFLKHRAYDITGLGSRPTCDDGEVIVLHGQGVTGRRCSISTATADGFQVTSLRRRSVYSSASRDIQSAPPSTTD